MLKFDKLHIEKQASKLDADFKKQTRIKPEINIDKILLSTEKRLKKTLKK